jgi:UDP-N-acetylglucosamine acyltransferase
MSTATKPNTIHPTAVISSRARIGQGCFIGPFCIVGDDVELHDGVRLDSHVVVDGHTTLGEDTRVFPFVSIGLQAQDLKYKGEPSETRIGKRNQIREFVTVHRGTAGGGLLTQIGNDCLLMAQVHIAHDCIIGDRVIMANAATLAGHVIIQDDANVGAYSGVHQFCRVGKEAYIGGYSVVVKDALPYALTVGNHAKCYGMNTTGMKRRGYSKEALKALHRAFHFLLASKLNTSQALEKMTQEIENSPEVDVLVEFIQSSRRGVIK